MKKTNEEINEETNEGESSEEENHNIDSNNISQSSTFKKRNNIKNKINHIDVDNMIEKNITVQNTKRGRGRGRPKKLN